jgi:hypothetical protein
MDSIFTICCSQHALDAAPVTFMMRMAQLAALAQSRWKPVPVPRLPMRMMVVLATSYSDEAILRPHSCFLISLTKAKIPLQGKRRKMAFQKRWHNKKLLLGAVFEVAKCTNSR